MSEFDRFFGGSPNLASTYKPTFLKCLLDIGNDENIEGSQWITQRENEYEVGLDFIAARFIYYYWPLKFLFKLKRWIVYTAFPKNFHVLCIIERHRPRKLHALTWQLF